MTAIPAARESLVDERTGMVSRPWYNFFAGMARDVVAPTAPVDLISSFSLSVGTVEIGATVTAVTANWSFSEPVTGATLTDTTITPADTTHDFTGLSLVSTKTYTLTGTTGTRTATASKQVSFSHKRYWGESASSTLDSAGIIAMNKEFSGSRSKGVTYNCTGGKYPYFCYPASWGTPESITVGGLSFSDFLVTVQDFTNASGNTTSFNVIRFNGIQNGSNIQVVWPV